MPVKVILAFAAVYLIWGSTYLAAQFGLETIPPYLIGTLRFVLAGIILLLWSAVNKKPAPSRKAVIVNSIGGVLILVGGSGSVLWAQQYLGSGLAAILVASLPIWFVIIDKKQCSYYFGDKRVIIGVILGFLGIIMLFGSSISNGVQNNSGWMQLMGIGVVLLGCISWTVGSLYVKYKAVEVDVATSAGIQLLAAGIFSLLPSYFSGEWNSFRFSQVSTEGWLSLLYLAIPGSVIAFMSYLYLLAVRPAAQAGTYAYVNPVIAVLLGVIFAHEVVNGWQILGLITILFSVLMINWSNYKAKS